MIHEYLPPPRREPITPAERRTGLLAWLVIAGIFLLVALAGCHRAPLGTDPLTNAELVAPPVGVKTAPRDSATAQAEPVKKPGLIARIFQKKPVGYDEKKPSNPMGFINPISVPRKCKGCQITYVQGNDNKVSQASAAKKAGPLVQADSGAAVTVTAIEKNKASAATAPGATATTTVTKPGFWATVAQELAGPGLVLGVLVAFYFLLRRKAKNTA